MTADEFWDSLDRTGECWLWTGPTAGGQAEYGRYGRVRVDGIGVVYAHRYAYELAHGPIADGLHVDHLCLVKLCCRPDHLEAVTPRENNLRAWTGRMTTDYRCGHPRTVENTYLVNGGKAGKCRICALEYARTQYEAKKEAASCG